MRHRAAARPTAVLLLAISIACQYDPVAHEFTSVKPSDEELIGQYELDDEGIEMLRHHDLTMRSGAINGLTRDALADQAPPRT